MEAGRALGGWGPELHLEEVPETLSLLPPGQCRGSKNFVTSSSHHMAASARMPCSLKCALGEIGCFWQMQENVGGQCPGGLSSSLSGENPAVTLLMCDFGCGLAFLWALAPPEPCCQSTEPVSHAGLSRSRTKQVLLIPSRRSPLLD